MIDEFDICAKLEYLEKYDENNDVRDRARTALANFEPSAPVTNTMEVDINI